MNRSTIKSRRSFLHGVGIGAAGLFLPAGATGGWIGQPRRDDCTPPLQADPNNPDGPCLDPTAAPPAMSQIPLPTGRPSDAVSVVIQGISLLGFRVAPFDVYFTPPTNPAKVDTLLDLLRPAAPRLQQVTGLPLPERIPLYVFADQDEWQKVALKLLNVDEMRDNVYWPNTALQPGIYVHLGLLDNPAAASNTLLYSFGQYVVVDAFRSPGSHDAGDAFGRWYPEGLSEIIRYQLQLDQFANDANSRWSGRMLDLESARVRQLLIPLPELETGQAWAARISGNKANMSWASITEATMAVDLLVRRFGWPKLVSVLAAVKNGQIWQEAFRSTFQQSVNEFHSAFLASIPTLYPFAVPSTLGDGGKFYPESGFYDSYVAYFGAVGFEPSEKYLGTLRDPHGSTSTKWNDKKAS